MAAPATYGRTSDEVITIYKWLHKNYAGKFDFRDVSKGLQKLRDFLIGRKHVGHQRFMPLISPRSIPRPEVPRGPCYKYSDQWYGNRHALGSVKPPVVAPVGVGRKDVCKASTNIDFPCLPTPGPVWWFDAHCYYKEVCYVAPEPPHPCARPPLPPPSTPTSPLPAKPAKMKEPNDEPFSKDDCDPCKPKK